MVDIIKTDIDIHFCINEIIKKYNFKNTLVNELLLPRNSKKINKIFKNTRESWSIIFKPHLNIYKRSEKFIYNNEINKYCMLMFDIINEFIEILKITTNNVILNLLLKIEVENIILYLYSRILSKQDMVHLIPKILKQDYNSPFLEELDILNKYVNYNMTIEIIKDISAIDVSINQWFLYIKKYHGVDDQFYKIAKKIINTTTLIDDIHLQSFIKQKLIKIFLIYISVYIVNYNIMCIQSPYLNGFKNIYRSLSRYSIKDKIKIESIINHINRFINLTTKLKIIVIRSYCSKFKDVCNNLGLDVTLIDTDLNLSSTHYYNEFLVKIHVHNSIKSKVKTSLFLEKLTHFEVAYYIKIKNCLKAITHESILYEDIRDVMWNFIKKAEKKVEMRKLLHPETYRIKDLNIINKYKYIDTDIQSTENFLRATIINNRYYTIPEKIRVLRDKWVDIYSDVVNYLFSNDKLPCSENAFDSVNKLLYMGNVKHTRRRNIYMEDKYYNDFHTIYNGLLGIVFLMTIIFRLDNVNNEHLRYAIDTFIEKRKS